MATKRRDEPDWPVGFGSAALLIVLVLGLVSGVPLEAVLLRSLLAALLGAVVGAMVGEAIRSFSRLAEQPATGRHIDWTVTDDLPEGAEPLDERGITHERIVPQAGTEGFTPIDFKHQVPQVRSIKAEQ